MPQTENKPICCESTEWQYLERNYDSWKKQLFIKGRRLTASTVWLDMIANNLSLEEVAKNKNLPLNAAEEAIKYCENNRELIDYEIDKEYTI